MRMLIFILLIGNAFAFDQEQLNKERKLLENEFLIKRDKTTPSNTAEAVNSKKMLRKRDESKIEDLESLYFDKVRTKVAAPQRRKRSR